MSSYHGSDMLGVKPRQKMMRNLARAIRVYLDLHKVPMMNVVLVGTGISGVAMASTLSFMLKCRWGFIRKDTDTDNHGYSWVASRYENDFHIAVDDFISSGDTIKRICDHIDIDAVAVDQDGLRTKDTTNSLHSKWGYIQNPESGLIDLITPYGEWNKELENEYLVSKTLLNQNPNEIIEGEED